MNHLGPFLMWAAFIAVDISFVGYVLSFVHTDNHTMRCLARVSFIGFAVFLTLASIYLMSLILNHEFIYSYVTQFSSRDLPLQYLISSFWAGQEGSFLLWVLLSSWLGLFLIFTSRDIKPQVMIIYNLNNLFLMLLLMKQSPFLLLPHAPPDGQGLNILLQDPWMVIHPPITFLGYAAFAVPFAFAMAALWHREYDSWVKQALPWTVFAFVSLGAGIIIGGYWSYKVLGWGGYWAWDPVENASLLPWLMDTALMHGMIVQRRLGLLRKTNFLLAAVSFCLIIYCTFLTRSGVLSDFSVHSFTDLGITGLLIGFMMVFLAGSLLLLIIRAKDIPVSNQNQSILVVSKEMGLMGAILILGLITVITGLGTSAPLITRLFNDPANVATEFYARTNMVPAIMLMLLLGSVPWLRWGGNNFTKRPLQWFIALAGAVAALLVTLFNGYPGMAVLTLVFSAGGVAGLNLVLTIQQMRTKILHASGTVAHLGVGLMFLGIVASSVYDQTEKVSLTQGMPHNAMGYAMIMLEPEYNEAAHGIQLDLPLKMSKGNASFVARPNIRAESTPDERVRRLPRPHIRRGLVSDLYISPLDFNPGDEDNHSSNHITLKKGERLVFQDYEFLFTDFDLTHMMESRDDKGLRVGAEIDIAYQDEKAVHTKLIFSTAKGPNPEARVRLPGPQKAFITLTGLDPGAKTIHLDYEGPLPDVKEKTIAKPPSMIVEVAVKPGMTILWFGVFLVLLGGCMGVARRFSISASQSVVSG